MLKSLTAIDIEEFPKPPAATCEEFVEFEKAKEMWNSATEAAAVEPMSKLEKYVHWGAVGMFVSLGVLALYRSFK